MVICTARQASKVDEVVIATDSKEVVEVANEYGFRAVLTREHHASGTDRVNEAATILGLEPDHIIINVQADEPFIEPEVIESVKDLVQKHRDSDEIMLHSVYKEIDAQKADDPNRVKVVLDSTNFALYFSRSKIPYPREELKIYYQHIGIYGYTRKMLERFCSLKEAPLENIEKLEQLRVLYHGYKIAMAKVKSRSIGVDTLEDLKRLSL